MNIVTAMPDFKRKHDTLLLWIHWLNLLVEPTYDLKLLRSVTNALNLSPNVLESRWIFAGYNVTMCQALHTGCYAIGLGTQQHSSDSFQLGLFFGYE